MNQKAMNIRQEKNSENYKPSTVPKVLSLIVGNGEERVNHNEGSFAMNEQTVRTEQSIFSRIGYVRYPTKDFDNSVAWYANVLGFRLRAVLDQGPSHSPDEREAVFNFGNPDSPHNVAFLLVETKHLTPIELSCNGSNLRV